MGKAVSKMGFTEVAVGRVTTMKKANLMTQVSAKVSLKEEKDQTVRGRNYGRTGYGQEKQQPGLSQLES